MRISGFSGYNSYRRVELFPRGILFKVLRRPSAGGLNGNEVRRKSFLRECLGCPRNGKRVRVRHNATEPQAWEGGGSRLASPDTGL